MKKVWTEPQVQITEFAANSYVSSCTTFTLYNYACDLWNRRVFFERNGKAGLQDSNTREFGYGDGSVTCLLGETGYTPVVKSDAEFMERLLSGSWDYDQRIWQVYSDDHNNAAMHNGPLGQADLFGHSAALQNHTLSSTYAYEVYDGYYYREKNDTVSHKAYLFYDKQNGIIHASSGASWTSEGRNRS